VGEFVSERDVKKKGKIGDGMEKFTIEPFRLSVAPVSRGNPSAGAGGAGASRSGG
jgi:hypothetical protein